MRKYLALLSICLPLLCGAQDPGRWSIEAVGAMGLRYGPQFSTGVQMSYDLFTPGAFRLGLGVGIQASKPVEYVSGSGKKGYDGLECSVPLFLHAGWFPAGHAASVIPYLKLNAGIQLLPLLTRPAAGSTGPHLVGATLEPQVGIRFGRGFYAAIGLWLQQVSYRLQKNGDAPITNMLLETTGQSALTPSLSVHFGIRL